MSWRCQRSSVSGLNGKAAQAGRGSERLSAASSARSARVSFGREICRRRNRQLVAEDENLQLLRATRPPQQPHQREQVPDNEIDERPDQPALPRRQPSAEPTEPNAPESRGQVCEPYGLAVKGSLLDGSAIPPDLRQTIVLKEPPLTAARVRRVPCGKRRHRVHSDVAYARRHFEPSRSFARFVPPDIAPGAAQSLTADQMRRMFGVGR
jgi:hypothetical protein